jgi:putative transposase
MEMRRSVFRDNYTYFTSLAPSHILDTTIEDVMFALNSLWKKGKDITLRKKRFSNTCRYGNSSPRGSFRYDNGNKYISLPKLPKLKLAESLRWDNAKIKTITIKKEAERYFISITCEIPDLPKSINQNRHLGVDWGISTYLTCFDGENIYEVDFDSGKLLKLDKSIAKHQKSLSRKKMFSKNWLKAKTKLQQSYLNFNNYRLDEIKKWVFEFDCKFDSVTLEDLGMKFVTSNRRLAHKAKQKPFYLFKITLINKFLHTGKSVFSVPKNYPSTQTCNACNYVKTGDEKMKLGEKIYVCPICNHTCNRDENAAKNLWSYRNLELAQL